MTAPRKPYPRISRAKHDRIVGRLQDSVNTLSSTVLALREENHRLTHTPEIKADTEAAFKRGVDHARRMFKNWMLGEADKIAVE